MKEGLPFSELESAMFSDFSPLYWAAKIIGALAGSMISLAYILPRGRREAMLRFGVGMVSGLVFGSLAGVKVAEYLGLLDHLTIVETAMVGAALTSLSAWWLLGAVQRLLERPLSPTRVIGTGTGIRAQKSGSERHNHER